MKEKNKQSLKQEFSQWKKINDLHGRHAFSKFIMLKFLEALQTSSDDFIFKGGNLLWHYIKTLRETVDLDLSTLNKRTHAEVESIFQECCYVQRIMTSITSSRFT